MNFPLFYPISGVVLALPLGVLPLELARVAWAGVGGALLFFAARPPRACRYAGAYTPPSLPLPTS